MALRITVKDGEVREERYETRWHAEAEAATAAARREAEAEAARHEEHLRTCRKCRYAAGLEETDEEPEAEMAGAATRPEPKLYTGVYL